MEVSELTQRSPPAEVEEKSGGETTDSGSGGDPLEQIESDLQQSEVRFMKMTRSQGTKTPPTYDAWRDATAKGELPSSSDNDTDVEDELGALYDIPKKDLLPFPPRGDAPEPRVSTPLFQPDPLETARPKVPASHQMETGRKQGEEPLPPIASFLKSRERSADTTLMPPPSTIPRRRSTSQTSRRSSSPKERKADTSFQSGWQSRLYPQLTSPPTPPRFGIEPDRLDAHAAQYEKVLTDKLDSSERFLLSQISAVREHTARGIKVQTDQVRRELETARVQFNTSVAGVHASMNASMDALREMQVGIEENKRDVGTILNTIESLKELVVSQRSGDEERQAATSHGRGRGFPYSEGLQELASGSRGRAPPLPRYPVMGVQAATAGRTRSDVRGLSVAQRGSGCPTSPSGQMSATSARGQSRRGVVPRDSGGSGSRSRMSLSAGHQERFSTLAQKGSPETPRLTQTEVTRAAAAQSIQADPLAAMGVKPDYSDPQTYETHFHEPPPDPEHQNYMYHVVPEAPYDPDFHLQERKQPNKRSKRGSREAESKPSKKCGRSERRTRRRSPSISDSSASSGSGSDTSDGDDYSPERFRSKRKPKRDSKGKAVDTSSESSSDDSDQGYSSSTHSDEEREAARKPKSKAKHRHRETSIGKGKKGVGKKSSKKHQNGPRRNMNCPVFKESDDWNDFRIQFEVFADQSGLEGSEKAAYLVSALKGGAKSCLSLLGREGAQDCRKLMTALSSLYSPKGSESRHGVSLMKRTYQGLKKESLPRYLQALRKLYVKAYGHHQASDRVIKDLFINGLDSRNLRTLVSVQRPRSSQEALDIALSIQSQTDDNGRRIKSEESKEIGAIGTNSGCKGGSGSHKRKGKFRKRKAKKTEEEEDDFAIETVAVAQPEPKNSNMEQVLQHLQKLEENVAALQKRPERKPLSEIVCYHCQLKGHTRNFCPEKPNRRGFGSHTEANQRPRFQTQDFGGQNRPNRPFEPARADGPGPGWRNHDSARSSFPQRSPVNIIDEESLEQDSLNDQLAAS